MSRKKADPARGAMLRRLRRRVTAASAALLASALVYQGLFGPGGLTELWSLRGSVADRQARIERLRAHNRELEESVRLLKTDRWFQEREIRERLGYVRPGEIVYRDRGG